MHFYIWQSTQGFIGELASTYWAKPRLVYSYILFQSIICTDECKTVVFVSLSNIKFPFHLRSIVDKFTFHLRSIVDKFTVHLRSIFDKFPFHLRSIVDKFPFHLRSIVDHLRSIVGHLRSIVDKLITPIYSHNTL